MATPEDVPIGKTGTNRTQGSPTKRGLGRLVKSSEPEAAREERMDTSGPTDIIEESSEDSFPASDAPGYASGQVEETRVEPGSQAET